MSLRGNDAWNVESSQSKLRVLYLLTHAPMHSAVAVQHDEQDQLANLLAVWNGDQLNGLAHTFADVVDLDIYLLLGYKLAQANRGHIV